MPETFVPPADNLVIMSLNGTNGFYGVICGQPEAEELLVYNLQLKSTNKVTLRQCIPCTPDNYQTMCLMKLWEGIIVKMPNKKNGVVRSGRMDIFGQECQLSIAADGQIFEWLPLSWFTATGHINATKPSQGEIMSEEKPRRPPIVGKPLWYQGEGDPEPQLGFLIGRTFDTVRGCELVIGLIAQGPSFLVADSTCWLAGYDEAKGAWSGIICTYPNWGVGIIQSSVWDDEKRDVYLQIESTLDGKQKGQLKYFYLSEVILDQFK